MIVFLLIVVACALSFVLLVKQINKGEIGALSPKEFLSAMLSAALLCAVIFSLLFIGDAHSDASYFIENRAYHEELVGAINENMSFETASKIIKDAEKNNNKIAKNRKYSNSIFVGVYFSKKVAKEEFIKIPKLKISAKNEF